MIIQTRYENTKCSICKTHIPFGADCVWVSGTPGVTCVTPCSPPQKKPRKVSGRVTPTPQVENASGGTATQAMGIPVDDPIVRKPCPQEGIEAFRETLATFDLQSLTDLHAIVTNALNDCKLELLACSPENNARALPAPFEKPIPITVPAEPYHCECQGCGHIWDTKEGKPAGCPWCGHKILELDKLGTCFNPIDTHSCRQWAFHDPDNAAHTKNCTSCQLQPRACIVLNKARQVVKETPKPATPVKPRAKFSF